MVEVEAWVVGVLERVKEVGKLEGAKLEGAKEEMAAKLEEKLEGQAANLAAKSCSRPS